MLHLQREQREETMGQDQVVCPWDGDSGGEEEEDEDWFYSSISSYKHLHMYRSVTMTIPASDPTS